MAIECAHCGTRCDDGVTRCPRCLRTTHLVAAPLDPDGAAGAAGAAEPTARDAERGRALVVAGLITTAALAAGVFVATHVPARPAPADAPAAATAPLATGPVLAPLVGRLRAEPDPLARARAAAEEIQRRRVATVAGEDDPVPPPRAPEQLWSVLATEGARVTELDLARLTVAVLRAAGDTAATVAERTAPARDGEPVDPTGNGRFVAASAGPSGPFVVEVHRGTLSAAEVLHRPLTEAEVAGAVSTQAALALVVGPGSAPDRAVQYANAGVDAWARSPVALAARARVWLGVGASSGLPLADADLRAAIALRDDAPYHLARARVLLLSSRVDEAATEAARAARLAPAWGPAALGALAFADVLRGRDAEVPAGCDGLRVARAPWTDDAYALCAPPGVLGAGGAGDAGDAVRTAAAGRLLRGVADPLRMAFAAVHGAGGVADQVRPPQRRETALWLAVMGHPELARALLSPADAGR